MEPSETEWAWFAGLYEGEGSVVVHRSARLHCRLQFKTTDEDVARLARARMRGGNVFGPYQYTYKDGLTRKAFWIWVNDGLDPRRLAAGMWPWLGERRRARLRDFKLDPEHSLL